MLKRNLPSPIKKSRKRSRNSNRNSRRAAIITGLRKAENQNQKMRKLVDNINKRLKSLGQGPYERRMEEFMKGMPKKRSPTLSKGSK